ncbi:MAG: exo-alpha-sialidase, partial [Candidatus Pacebacteria bacterium]|nr:exo-alpha-sialidase [Candidatus Paceibacterota bacterium]
MKNELLTLGNRRELFVDRLLIDRLDNTHMKLHEPVSGGTAIAVDKPWEGPGNGPRAVFEHQGRLLMYYRAMTLDPGDECGVLCVAVSTDRGRTWSRPELGLVERAGRRDTNIVGDEAGDALAVVPWLDTRPGVSENERVKALASQPISGEKHTAFKDPKGPKKLVLWGSPDGFRFHKLAEQPDLVSDLPNCFDGGNTLFWSDAEQQYVLYYRCMDKDGKRRCRTVARTTSRDLIHWTDSEVMNYGESPREQFYTNNTQPYFRAPHIYIAPAARFLEGRRVVTDAHVKEIGLKMSHGNFYGNDCSDGVLLTSRAGSTRYDRTFMETFIRPGLGAANWTSRTNYPLTGILPAGPDQIQIFLSRHYMHPSWHIERLLLRTDGFASVSAPWTGGEMVTKPFVFAGERLDLNYRTGAPGFIRVEIQNT